MKIPLFIYQLFLTVIFSSFSLIASAAFAELVSLTHDCGEGGSVEFVLNGDPDSYTYYWEHGPTDLSLTNLSPGTYTLFVTNFYGCIEKYDIEILPVGGCQMSAQFFNTFDPCLGIIKIAVFTSSGDIIDEAALDIQWADGSNAGLNREVHLGTNGNYCVTIALTGDNESCCTLSECIHVQANPNCGEYCDDDMLVNEINKNTDGSGQYVELLVVGKCECEKKTDIRGFILDDNNGDLIQGNDLTNFPTIEQTIGLSPGYLVFSQSDNWKEVPTGSLIVIYDERDNTVPNLPVDDPTDSNNDGVYVLQVNDPEYFYAKTGMWNENEKTMDYSGSIINSEWSKININTPADGFQIRNNEGEFHHGISIGETSFSEPNSFSMWLSEFTTANENCQLTGLDHWNTEDFICYESNLFLHTPGQANSNKNNELITSLKDCDYVPVFGLNQESQTRKQLEDKQTTIHSHEVIRAFPNPFTNKINLEFNSDLEGMATLQLFTVDGKLIYQKEIATVIGNNLHELAINESLPPGLLLLQFKFPSGQMENLRITHLNRL